MTANKPMTGAQLDELMAVAMRMQSDSEKMGERSVSIFAYAVQVAVLEIRETRCKYEELQSQNTNMAVQLANAESKCRELAAENAGLKNPENWLLQSDYGYEASEVATQNGATEDESLRAGMIAIINRIGTPATDAFLAEVRAQGVDYAIGVIEDCANNLIPGGTGESVQYAQEMVNPYLDSIHDKLADKSAQLRKGAAL
ncbi:hypothetical protein EOL25_25430 [Citrobacter freundii]|uniref:hypothetical protein n=1 Tax=Citrobacter freundii TaxID=546 RepID=UPI000FD999D2|nr:hypothetical protein [Citrobacter freundii]RVR52509.1 hypothetical protein EOL25_25430 [Citrobacter freundii]